MRIAILGGGPAGLYFAILMKRADPAHDITVYERNRADDTFGFGVVFSDQTLETFERYDRPSFEAITREFAYWQDIEIRHKGTVHRIGGNGFCGCARRTLLMLLQARARSLGVALEFRHEITSLAEVQGADLIVAADGINSAIRQSHAEHFRPVVDLRSNKFTWMGSTKPLDAFLFSFRETEWGVFIAHAYQYEAGRSTWVLETDPATWERAGLDRMSEDESARFMEGVFAADLDGHALITNRSLWRSFPMIRNGTSVMGNVVLLGDAKATAHFSIGSGTKLAMEDAIGLFEAFRAQPDVPGALQHFEATRREDVEKIQHAADVSLVWFEQVRRFWGMDPVQFAFGVMTRSKSITYDNLRLRAPDFVDQTDQMFASQVRAAGFDVAVDRPLPPMFQPFKLRGMVLANRVVVSPMCMYSAQDGVPGDWHMVHYGTRAIGGAGLVFTEMTDVSPEARITPGCTGPIHRRAGSRLGAHHRFRAHAFAGQDVPATGPCRPQGCDAADVGGHGPPPAQRRLGYRGPVGLAVLPRKRRAAGDDSRRHGPRGERFPPSRHSGRARRVRHAGGALCARLFAGDVPLAADQPAHRRVWRHAGEPVAFSA